MQGFDVILSAEAHINALPMPLEQVGVELAIEHANKMVVLVENE